MTGKVKEMIKSGLRALNLEVGRINKRPTVFFEIDSDFYDFYFRALKNTQLAKSDNIPRRQRNYVLTRLIGNIGHILNEGQAAECGCWRGATAYQIAHVLSGLGFKNRLYLFDSFEGLSDFQDEDLKDNPINDKEGRRKQFACSLDVVRENLKEFDFIKYEKGWIPECFNNSRDLKFSFVHIDVDLYRPIKDSLEFFYPRMIRDGIIVLDDYGYLSFPGAKRAVDEFMSGRDDFFLPLPFGGAFLIKR